MKTANRGWERRSARRLRGRRDEKGAEEEDQLNLHHIADTRRNVRTHGRHQEIQLREQPPTRKRQDEPEAGKEADPGDDGAERGSIRGQIGWRRRDHGKPDATTPNRPSSKSAGGHHGHSGRRPEAGGRHSRHKQHKQAKQTTRGSPGAETGNGTIA